MSASSPRCGAGGVLDGSDWPGHFSAGRPEPQHLACGTACRTREAAGPVRLVRPCPAERGLGQLGLGCGRFGRDGQQVDREGGCFALRLGGQVECGVGEAGVVAGEGSERAFDAENVGVGESGVLDLGG